MRDKQKSIPITRASKKAGVKWMMVDGVQTEAEARRLENIFIEDQNKIKNGYYTYDSQTHAHIVWTDEEIEQYKNRKK